MAGFREAGAAFVRIFTKNDVKPGLNQAEADVRAATGRMQQAATTGGIGGIGRGIKEWARPLKTFQSAITGTIGIAAGFLGTISLIGAAVAAVAAGGYGIYRAFGAAKRESDELKKSVNEAAKALINATRINTGNEISEDWQKAQEAIVATGAKIEEVEKKYKEALQARDDARRAMDSAERSGAYIPQEMKERSSKQYDKPVDDLANELRQLRGANATASNTDRRKADQALAKWAKDDAEGRNPQLREMLYVLHLINETGKRNEEQIRAARDQLKGTTVSPDQRAAVGLLKIIANKSRGSY